MWCRVRRAPHLLRAAGPAQGRRNAAGPVAVAGGRGEWEGTGSLRVAWGMTR